MTFEEIKNINSPVVKQSPNSVRFRNFGFSPASTKDYSPTSGCKKILMIDLNRYAEDELIE